MRQEADDPSTHPAPHARWLAGGEHLHHLVRPARGRVDWCKDRSWCETGTAVRTRKSGTVTVPDALPKNLIEAAYAQDRVPVWTEDEASPYQTVPYPSAHWHPVIPSAIPMSMCATERPSSLRCSIRPLVPTGHYPRPHEAIAISDPNDPLGRRFNRLPYGLQPAR